jgi:hypothetical protein
VSVPSKTTSRPTPPQEYDDAYVAEQCFNDEGIDRTLILAALELTVEQRLERLAMWTAGIIELRNAYDAAQLR